MSRTRNLLATTAVALGSTTALVTGGVAHADPATPLPISSAQAPGLPAMENLSPIIQQAANDPAGAVSLLMAAAQAFAANKDAPEDSQTVANAVTSFVSDPVAPQAHITSANLAPGVPKESPHVVPVGVVPGAESHLLPGVDPANAAGPAPEPEPLAAAEPAPEAVPEPAPAPEAPPAPAEGPDAVPVGFSPDTPPTQDFMYPSIGNGCLADGGNSLATALSVAGPAKIPAPGPGPGQTAYVFTAVGTGAPAEVQKLPLNVTWVNLSTGKSGTATLKPHPDINPNGPTTMTAIVDTGSGSIMSTIFGQVTTVEKQCQFMPTIGSSVVP